MPTFQLSKSDREKVLAAIKRTEKPAAALQAAAVAYNEAIAPLRELVRALESDWQAAWDKRSERWQDSAAGQVVAETIVAWSSLADDLEDIDLNLPEIEIPDQPTG